MPQRAAWWALFLAIHVLSVIGGDAADSEAIGHGLAYPAGERAGVTSVSAAPHASWKKMLNSDKKMSLRQADDSYFAGHMSQKEHAFAAAQGGQNELFAMSDKDRELATSQAAVRLDKKALGDLVTPLDTVSTQDIADLASIKQEASQRTAKIRKKLAKLKNRTQVRKPETGLARLLNSISNQINAAATSDPVELGEGMSVGRHEKVTKAQQRAKIEMMAMAKRHNAAIKQFRKEMKEMLNKQNRIRMASESKARKLVPNAIKEYTVKWNANKRGAKAKSMKLMEMAATEYRNVQAQSIKSKQAGELHFTSKKNTLLGEQSRVKMDANAAYQKLLATFATFRARAVAKSKRDILEATSRLRDQERKNREQGLAQGKSMKSKFAEMKRKLKARSKRQVTKLMSLEKKTKAGAKKKLDTAIRKAKKNIVVTKAKSSMVKKKAEIRLAEAKGETSKADREKTKALHVKLKLKNQVAEMKMKAKKAMRKILKQKSDFQIKLKRERKEVGAKEKMRESAMAKKGTMSDAEYKKKQMNYLKMVKKNSFKNCHAAKKSAILQARASRFAMARTIRMAADMATMKHNLLMDMKSKGKKFMATKERAQKKLKRVVQQQAAQMSINPTAYDASAIQKAAQAFAKANGPASKDSALLKKMEASDKNAQANAKKQTPQWAKKKALMVAKKLKASAKATCDKEQQKYETVKYRVRKRLGLAGESEHKALLKGAYKQKRWAMKKISVKIGKFAKVSEKSEKDKSKLNEKDKKAEKNAELKSKQKIKDAKERRTKYTQAAKRKESRAKAAMAKDAAKKKARLAEQQKLITMAQKAYRIEVKKSQTTTRKGTETILRESRSESQKITTRQTKAMLVLSRSGKMNLKAGFVTAKKKAMESRRKAEQQEQDRVNQARKKRDDEIRKSRATTKQKISQLKLALSKGKSGADSMVMRAKLIMSRKKQEAKRILAESLSQGAGLKQDAVYKAKQKAKQLLTKAQQISQKGMRDAKRIFINKVKKETAKYLAQIKASKAKLKGEFQSSAELLQLEEYMRLL